MSLAHSSATCTLLLSLSSGYFQLLSRWSAPRWPGAAVRPGCPPLLGILQHRLQSPRPPSQTSSWAFASTPGSTLTNTLWPVKALTTASSETTRALSMSSSYAERQKGMPQLDRAWQNVIHWRRQWPTTSVFLPWEPHEHDEKAKRNDTERWSPQNSRYPKYYWGREEKWRCWAKVEMTPNCGYTWWWK